MEVYNMTATNLILTEVTASISEFKKNPMRIVAEGEGFPVAILNRNKPAFYCIPANVYEVMMDKLEDLELNALADAREGQPEIEVNIDDL
jgi:antitoxin StbD